MIKIIRDNKGDTRTAVGEVSFEAFQIANDRHRADVKNVMEMLAEDIEEAGERHDHTKKEFEKLFYDEFTDSRVTGSDFKEKSWYKRHILEERHHLNDHIPDGVDLVDVLEMISDCVCAGLARSGTVRDVEIDSEVLQTAVKNTVGYIKSQCVLVDEGEVAEKGGENG